jgi:tRNA A-37 threonylcarbamoyl transferase component Bud32
MPAVEKPNSEPLPAQIPAADPKDIPTDAISTNLGELSEPSGPHPFRVIWPEPSAPNPPSDDLNGNTEIHLRKRLGRYEIVEEIAKGGMGVIYKALDTQLNRHVALKMLRTGPLSRPEELRRFKREAQAQARIKHRHILEVFDVGECDGMQYFTMPLVPGGSLNKRRKDFTGQAHKVVPLVEKVARAVEHAHSKGVLHRDIKPGNILLDENDEPLVGDFGLAKMEDSSVLLTRSDQVIGTPAYMAPEQANSSPTNRVTPRTDVWGLGVLLYELLTGELPFKGPTSSAVIQEILNKRPTSPRRLKGDIDPVLEKIILRCLEKEPPWRYPSAAALADDLARWQKGERVESVRKPLGHWFQRTARQVPLWQVAAAVVIVLLVCVSLWLATRDGEPSPAPTKNGPEKKAPQREAFEDHLDQLRQGKAAILIDSRGGPKWFRFAYGMAATTKTEDMRYSFGCQAEGRCRIELLPYGLPVMYRVSAEIEHESPERGIVGFYVMDQQNLALPLGHADLFFSLTFGQHKTLPPYDVPARPLSAFWLMGHFQPRPDWSGITDELSWDVNTPHQPGTASPEADVMKRIALEVRPGNFRVFWEGNLVFEGTRPYIEAQHHFEGRGFPFPKDHVPNAFSTQGGLGIYLDSARMVIRNMVVEPLDK